jgi:hypothetical protein
VCQQPVVHAVVFLIRAEKTIFTLVYFFDNFHRPRKVTNFFQCLKLAFGVPHFSLEEIEFHGYTIPKGSVILSSIYNVGRDPEHFPDPETFNPERFIDPGEVLLSSGPNAISSMFC